MDQLTLIDSVAAYKKAINDRCCIMFTATWCPDCAYTKTYIGEIVKENPGFKFYYIDRDQLLDLCIELEIMGIPSFITYDHGKETGRFVSKLRKTKQEVQSFLDSVR